MGPDYIPPKINVPDDWAVEFSKGNKEGQVNLREWWLLFNDPILSKLIERADRGNLDLRAAVSRIDEARAQWGVVRGSQFPKVKIDASYTRSRQSADSSFGGKTLGDFGSVKDVNTHKAALSAGWEIDVFGRVGRAIESSHASWQASVEDGLLETDVSIR